MSYLIHFEGTLGPDDQGHVFMDKLEAEIKAKEFAQDMLDNPLLWDIETWVEKEVNT